MTERISNVNDVHNPELVFLVCGGQCILCVLIDPNQPSLHCCWYVVVYVIVYWLSPIRHHCIVACFLYYLSLCTDFVSFVTLRSIFTIHLQPQKNGHPLGEKSAWFAESGGINPEKTHKSSKFFPSKIVNKQVHFSLRLMIALLFLVFPTCFSCPGQPFSKVACPEGRFILVLCPDRLLCPDCRALLALDCLHSVALRFCWTFICCFLCRSSEIKLLSAKKTRGTSAKKRRCPPTLRNPLFLPILFFYALLCLLLFYAFFRCVLIGPNQPSLPSCLIVLVSVICALIEPNQPSLPSCLVVVYPVIVYWLWPISRHFISIMWWLSPTICHCCLVWLL